MWQETPPDMLFKIFTLVLGTYLETLDVSFKISTFGTTNMAGKSPDVFLTISALFARNKAENSPDVSFKMSGLSVG